MGGARVPGHPGTISIGADLEVNRLGFGAMRITGSGVWGEPADPDECRAVLRRAVELGVNLIDTADSYGPDVSERLIAEALHPYPAGLVIATKGGLIRSGPGRWSPDGRPEHLRAACEGSLRRLRLEAIDLYQLHRPDPGVPYQESLGALVELRAEGKIRHIGISNVGLKELETATATTEVASVQNRFNLSDRRNLEVLTACERLGIAFLPWAPLDAGAAADGGTTLGRIAAAQRAQPAQVALAWLLHASPATVPIPGTSSLPHLESNVAAARIELAPAEVQALTDTAPSRLSSLGRAMRSRVGRVASRLRR